MNCSIATFIILCILVGNIGVAADVTHSQGYIDYSLPEYVDWTTDCGPISVYVAAKLLGVEPNLTECVRLCERKQDRTTTAGSLLRALKSYGLDAIGIRANKKLIVDELQKGHVAILHLDNHFVVAIKANNYELILLDPKLHACSGVRHLVWSYEDAWWPSKVAIIARRPRSKELSPNKYYVSKSVTSKNDFKSTTTNQVKEFSRTHDFGEVKVGDILACSFVVENTSSMPLEVSDVKKSCGCATAQVNPRYVKAGENFFVNVVADTRDSYGQFNTQVVVQTTSPKKELANILLSIKAKPVGSVLPVPQSLNFGAVVHGNSTMSYIRLVGGASDFVIADMSTPSPYIDLKEERDKFPSDSLPSIAVKLKKDIPIGPFEAKLSVRIQNGGRSLKKIIPVYANILPKISVEPSPVILDQFPSKNSSEFSVVCFSKNAAITQIQCPAYAKVISLAKHVKTDRIIYTYAIRPSEDASHSDEMNFLKIRTDLPGYELVEVPLLTYISINSSE